MKKPLAVCAALMTAPAGAEELPAHPVDLLRECVQTRFADFAINNIDGSTTFVLTDKLKGSTNWTDHVLTVSPDTSLNPYEVVSTPVTEHNGYLINQGTEWFNHPPTAQSVDDFALRSTDFLDPDGVVYQHAQFVQAHANGLLEQCQSGELRPDQKLVSEIRAWRLFQGNFEQALNRLQECHWIGEVPAFGASAHLAFEDLFEDSTFEEMQAAVQGFQEQAQLHCPDA